MAKKKKPARKKRDPNKPKAAKSAYLYFCTAKRLELKVSEPGLPQQELLSKMGVLWKATTDRTAWKEMATADKARFVNEMKTYVPPPMTEEEKAATAAKAAAKKTSKAVAKAMKSSKPKPKAKAKAKAKPKAKAKAKAGSPKKRAAPSSAAKSTPTAKKQKVTTPKKKPTPMSPKRRAKLARARARSGKKKKVQKIKLTKKFIRDFETAQRKRKRERDAATKKHDAVQKALDDGISHRYPIEDADLAAEPLLDPPLPPTPAPKARIAWPEDFVADDALPTGRAPDGARAGGVSDLIYSWDFLRTFSTPLKLTPFSIGAFRKALLYEKSSLDIATEIHVALLTMILNDRPWERRTELLAILRKQCPGSKRRHLHELIPSPPRTALLTQSTWPEILRALLVTVPSTLRFWSGDDRVVAYGARDALAAQPWHEIQPRFKLILITTLCKVACDCVLVKVRQREGGRESGCFELPVRPPPPAPITYRDVCFPSLFFSLSSLPTQTQEHVHLNLQKQQKAWGDYRAKCAELHKRRIADRAPLLTQRIGRQGGRGKKKKAVQKSEEEKDVEEKGADDDDAPSGSSPKGSSPTGSSPKGSSPKAAARMPRIAVGAVIDGYTIVKQGAPLPSVRDEYPEDSDDSDSSDEESSSDEEDDDDDSSSSEDSTDSLDNLDMFEKLQRRRKLKEEKAQRLKDEEEKKKRRAERDDYNDERDAELARRQGIVDRRNDVNSAITAAVKANDLAALTQAIEQGVEYGLEGGTRSKKWHTKEMSKARFNLGQLTVRAKLAEVRYSSSCVALFHFSLFLLPPSPVVASHALHDARNCSSLLSSSL